MGSQPMIDPRIPNPWIILSAAPMIAAEPAVAMETPPVVAAGPITEPSMTMEVQEPPAARAHPSSSTAGGFDIDGTEFIGDLMRYARMRPDREEFPRGFDPHEFMDTLEQIVNELDPVPEFMRARA